MRISLGWLRELVDVDVSDDELKSLLDFSGTKVETVARPGEAIDGVVVAEVIDVRSHPNADNLTLVEVSTGPETETVVCGARNFQPGDRVPLARVGARLSELAISERKIRGEISRGMLCSGAELGVSKDHSGILVLSPDAPLGEDVVKVLHLDDAIFELEVTPNRGDCMGMIGVAREVAALTGKELRMPDATVAVDDSVTARVEVSIEDPEGCPRFTARVVDGVTVGPSPEWMTARLTAAGIRPISNIVDITNYIMLETGHPLHAYDRRRLRGDKFVVRRARAGERFITLDGEERSMSGEDLMVCDAERALGIAGVMGGEESEVSAGTTTVVLECAYFDPALVSITSRRHFLRTEASARFERGADPEDAAYASNRAARLMAELAGGRVASELVDEYPVTVARRSLVLRSERTGHVLGYRVDAARQAAWLRAVGFTVEEAGGALHVTVPTFRPDVEREVDLIEEVARLEGYDKLPATLPGGGAGGLERDQQARRTLARSLAGVGLSEAWTPSMFADHDLDALGLAGDHPARSLVRIANPMTENESAMRTTLLPGLLRSVARNVAHRARSIALFEIAHVYEPSGEILPRESEVLCAAFCGDRLDPGWARDSRNWDFFAAKGVLEAVLDSVGVTEPETSPASGMPFHPTRAAAVALEGAPLGVVGEIHPDVCGRFDVPEGTVAFEIALEPVYASLPGRAKVEHLPRFPALYIDLALVVDEEVAAAAVEGAIHDAGAPEVTSVGLFDVYRGDQVPEGKKSLAYALEIRLEDRTPTEEDETRVRDRILRAVEEKTGARLRGGP